VTTWKKATLSVLLRRDNTRSPVNPAAEHALTGELTATKTPNLRARSVQPVAASRAAPTFHFATAPTTLLRFLNSHLQGFTSRQKRLVWRLGVLLLLTIVAAAFFAYGYVDLVSYNHYCKRRKRR
jgi:hypothetical protein